jgi:hypothetical protein
MPVTSFRQIISIRPRLSTITRAAILSQLKMSTITDTFLKRDSEFARYRSSMIGDIAKLCAKEWLERQHFEVTDWDDVRSSWRSSRKRFDLEVNACKIEIASSIEQLDHLNKNTALSQILQEKSIIQPVRRTVKDVVLQVYFISDSNPIVHLMGWCRWEDMQQYQTIRYIAGRPRDFWLMPFGSTEARPPFDLIGVLSTWRP